MHPKKSFRFVIDAPARCVLVAWAGDISARSLVESQVEIVSDPQFEPGMPILHDCRGATFSDVDYPALGKLVPLARDFDSQGGAGRGAFVVSSTFDYGVMRQFSLLRDGLEDGPIDRQPFYELEDACAWLDVSPEVLERLPVVTRDEVSEGQPTAL